MVQISSCVYKDFAMCCCSCRYVFWEQYLQECHQTRKVDWLKTFRTLGWSLVTHCVTYLLLLIIFYVSSFSCIVVCNTTSFVQQNWTDVTFSN